MRFISPAAHGMLDYLFAVTAFSVPRVMNWSRRSTRLMTGVAGFALIYALLTRYKLGLVKVLPMKAHLGLDAALNAFLVGAQFQLSEEETSVRAMIFGLAGFGALATLFTRPEATHEDAQQ